MTVLILVSLLQRVSPKLSFPLGSAWFLWQICQYRSQFESKIRFDLQTKIEPELQYCIFRSDCKLSCQRLVQKVHFFGFFLKSRQRMFSAKRLICFSSWWWKRTEEFSNFDYSQTAWEHSLENFWSSDNFSNRSSYSCNKFPVTLHGLAILRQEVE